MNERVRHLLKGILIIIVAFIALYAIGAAYDYGRNADSVWTIGAYHGRLGRLLVFSGWITVIAFLLADLAKRRGASK